jgi:pimeloyl-ACP methyl ester carboxylesterase
MTAHMQSSSPMPPAPSPAPATKIAPTGLEPRPRGHIGWIVAGSLTAGLVAALALVAAPFIPAEGNAVTGAILCGFALGWAMVTVLSVRFTDQPQRWAAAPALLMGAGGLLLIGFGSSVGEQLSWVWPPTMLAVAGWMIVGAHRRLRSPARRWLVYPVAAVLALVSIGGGYATVGAAADARAYLMPGQLIDVGGHRLHLSCTGSGSPTVVLEPGAGEMSSNMGWIVPGVARDTRVCAYDRAGHGWSEPADTAQDGSRIATDLHTVLERGHVPGPYVMVGHSFGGLYVLAFAARYPDEVAGMVLVDSTAPASVAEAGAASSRDGGTHAIVNRVSALLSASARLGLGRLYGQVASSDLPSQSRDEVRATGATEANLRSTIDEYVQANTSMKQAASLDDFAGKPLVVLTAGSGNDAAWAAAQDELATLSTNSVHRVIDDATHESLIGDREDAAATGRAILDVVASVRTAGPLAR